MKFIKKKLRENTGFHKFSGDHIFCKNCSKDCHLYLNICVGYLNVLEFSNKKRCVFFLWFYCLKSVYPKLCIVCQLLIINNLENSHFYSFTVLLSEHRSVFSKLLMVCNLQDMVRPFLKSFSLLVFSVILWSAFLSIVWLSSIIGKHNMLSNHQLGLWSN